MKAQMRVLDAVDYANWRLRNKKCQMAEGVMGWAYCPVHESLWSYTKGVCREVLTARGFNLNRLPKEDNPMAVRRSA